jgi:hypothetical protein
MSKGKLAAGEGSGGGGVFVNAIMTYLKAQHRQKITALCNYGDINIAK